MKTHWLVAVLSLQVILSPAQGNGGTENDFPKLVSHFVKVAADQLMNDPAFAEKVKDILADLKEAFSGKEYQGTFIPTAVKMLDIFVNNGYFIAPETMVKLMRSVIHQATREPDKLSNNLRRIGHRGTKLVGDTIKNVGSLGSAVVRVVEDAHNKQRQYMDPIFAEIPYLGTILLKINSAIAKVIGAVHTIVKLGVKGVGTIISDYAERRRLNLKRKTAEERRAANEADEVDDEEEEEPESEEEAEDDKSKPKDKTSPDKKTDGEKEKPTKKGEKKKPPEKKNKDGNPDKEKEKPQKDDKGAQGR